MPKIQLANNLPEWMTGWQNDGHFIAPNSKTGLLPLPSRIDHLTTPHGLSKKALIGDTKPSLQTQNSYAMLAVLTSLAAPFFYHLRKPGVCIHFHGNTKAARDALLYSASSVWESSVYDFQSVRGHIYGLKIFHKDTALCLSEVPKKRKNDMRKFLRRYFLGRTGADPGIPGVVISTGEAPLTPSTSRNAGLNAFIENRRPLAIDISLGAWPNQYAFQADHRIPSKLINTLLFNVNGIVSSIYDEQSRLSQYETNRAGLPACEPVSSFFWCLNAIANHISDNGGFNWWAGGALPSIFQRLIDEVDNQYNVFMGFLKNLVNNLPTLIQLGGKSMEYRTSYILLKDNRVLIPATAMQRLVPENSLKLAFTSWLEKNGVILTRRKGKTCDAHHSPRHKKPIQGYRIDPTRAIELSAKINQQTVSYSNSIF